MVALAQSDGTITTGASTINIAQCSGVKNAEVSLTDDLTVDLTWKVALPTDVTFASGGSYQLYAANAPLSAGDTASGTSCAQQASGSSVSPFHSGAVGDSWDAPTQTISIAKSVSMRLLAEAAQYACDGDANQTVYLCIQWTGPQGGQTGWAKATMTLDLTPPGAPSAPQAGPGDGKLHVSCTGGTGDQTFQARAAAAGQTTRFSSPGDSCSDLKITGLTNGIDYTVVVFGIDSANNPSVASASTTGTPVPTDDFFDHYKHEGGPDSGGCTTAAGAAGLLGGLALLALRRRKP
jgi:MYXO-CTERM domain-containing protein